MRSPITSDAPWYTSVRRVHFIFTDHLDQSYSATQDLPRIQPWLWLNVMSLDPPVIAVLWQLLLARGLHVRVNPPEPAVLALAVWTVYIGDHILDVLRPATGEWEPIRKRFYRRHLRWAWITGVCLPALVLTLARHFLRPSTFHAGEALAIAVGGYFGMVHLTPAHWRKRWPREAAVATLFTLGTFMHVWMMNGRNLRTLSAPAMLFALLCWANCCVIETWEWQRSTSGEVGAPSASTRWAARHLTAIALGTGALAALMGYTAAAPPGFSIAALASALALALLGIYRSQLRVGVRRAVADAALCTPLVALTALWVR